MIARSVSSAEADDLHVLSLPLSGHAQAFFYGFDIRLHLPEMSRISRLDVFSHAFDLFQDLRDGFGIVSDPQKGRDRLV